MVWRLLVTLILFSSCIPKEEELSQIETSEDRSQVEKKEFANTKSSYEEYIDYLNENTSPEDILSPNQFKTNQLLERVAQGNPPPQELILQPIAGPVVPGGIQVENQSPINHQFNLGDEVNHHYLELSFQLNAGDRLYIPFKKYCINQNGSGFHLCKYNAIIDWGDNKKSIISNQTIHGSFTQSYVIQNSGNQPATFLSHTYSTQNNFTVKIKGLFEGLGSRQHFNRVYKDSLISVNSVGNISIPDLSYAFYDLNRPNISLSIPDILNVNSATSMFENAKLKNLHIGLLNLSKTFSMKGTFKGLETNNLTLRVQTYPKLSTISEIFKDSQINGSINNLNRLGISSIKFFNKSFKNARIKLLDLSQWNFQSAITVSEMFHQFRGKLILDAWPLKTLRIRRSLNNAFTNSPNYNLECLRFTTHSYVFNKKCPKTRQGTINYRKYVADEKDKFKRMNQDWSPAPGAMKLSIVTTTKNQSVKLPFSTDTTLRIFWGDNQMSNDSIHTHEYSTPDTYYVTIVPPNDGIPIDLNRIDDSWKNSIRGVYNFGKIKTPTLEGLFKNCARLEFFKLGQNYTPVVPVRNFSSMFLNAINLSSLDLSNLVTDSASNISSMFEGTTSLERVNTKNWNTSTVTNFSKVFFNSTSIEKLDLSHWNVSSGSDFTNTFKNASFLKHLNISGWDIGSDGVSVDEMLANLDNLDTLDIRALREPQGDENFGLEPDGALVMCSSMDGFWGDIPCENFAFEFTFLIRDGEENQTLTIPTHQCADGQICYRNITVCWGDETPEVPCQKFEDPSNKINLIHTYTSPGTKKVVVDGASFYGFGTNSYNEEEYTVYKNGLKKARWGVLPVVKMKHAFSGTTALNSFSAPRRYINDSHLTDVSYLFYDTEYNGEINLNGFKFQKVTTMKSMFESAKRVKKIYFNTTNTIQRPVDLYRFVKNTSALNKMTVFKLKPTPDNPGNMSMREAFFNTNLEEVNINHWDVSRVSSLNQTFRYSNFKTLNLSSWAPAQVTSMSHTFSEMFNVTHINIDGPGWANMPLVSTHALVFNGHDYREEGEGVSKLKKIIGIENLDVSNSTNFQCFFQSLINWEFSGKLNWHTPKLTNLGWFLQGARKVSNLDISSFTLSKVTSFRYSFYNAQNLETLSMPLIGYHPLGNSAPLIRMDRAFYNTKKLKKIDGISSWDTSKVSNFKQAFLYSGISNIDISGWVVGNVNTFEEMFYGSSIQVADMSTWNIKSNEAVEEDTDEGTKNLRFKHMFSKTSKLGRVIFPEDQSFVLDIDMHGRLFNNIQSTFDNNSNDYKEFVQSIGGTWSLISNAIQNYSYNGILQARESIGTITSQADQLFSQDQSFAFEDVPNFQQTGPTNAPLFCTMSKPPELVEINFKNNPIDNYREMFLNFQGSLELQNFKINSTSGNIEDIFKGANIEYLSFDNLSFENLVTGATVNLFPTYQLSMNQPSRRNFASFSLSTEAGSEPSVKKFEISNVDVLSNEHFDMLFATFNGLEEIKISYWTWGENIQSVSNMFTIQKAKQVCLPNGFIDSGTTNITSLNFMFSGLGSQNEGIGPALNLTSWNTQNIEDLSSMFTTANLSNVDLSGWNVRKVDTVVSMFHESKISTLNLTNWSLDKLVGSGPINDDNVEEAAPWVFVYDSKIQNFLNLTRKQGDLTQISLYGWEPIFTRIHDSISPATRAGFRWGGSTGGVLYRFFWGGVINTQTTEKELNWIRVLCSIDGFPNARKNPNYFLSDLPSCYLTWDSDMTKSTIQRILDSIIP